MATATKSLSPRVQAAIDAAKAQENPQEALEAASVTVLRGAGVQDAVNEKLQDAAVDRPKTRNELHAAVKKLSGYHIPRVAVCEGHVAPFTTFADLYFGKTEDGEPVTDVLWIGNRGGGKTTNSGFLHGAKGRWMPGYGTAIVGATERQSERGYSEFQRFTRFVEDEIEASLQKLTKWLAQDGSGVQSQTEIITGTMKGVNGPHPHLAQFDEVELTQRAIYEEWLNMSQGDERYPGQNLLTSTRKFSYGIVQEIVEEVEEAKARGEKPAWRVDIFCVYETVKRQEGCGTTCGCEKVIKGTREVGQGQKVPRTLKDVCGGRAARSDGFVSLVDVKRRFRSLSARTWEAQQECLRPGAEGLVHPWFGEHCYLPDWYPRAEYGPIYRSWDWGGTDPHAVFFHQRLKAPVILKMTVDGNPYERLIPQGVLITFDGVYHSGGSYTELGREVFERTIKWQNYGYEMEIEFDAADPAGATAKKDVTLAAQEGGYTEPKWSSIPAPLDDSIDKHYEWGDDGNVLLVPKRVPDMVWEYSRYHWPEKKPDKPTPKNPVDVDNHAMDSVRYIIWQLYKKGVRSQSNDIPTSQYQRLPHPTEREGEANARRKKTYSGSAPGGSTASPDYTQGQPQRDVPTVRRMDTPSVRRRGTLP